MSDADAIAFAEKALAMLDQGSFTATYKFAVLLALLDACLEGSDRTGAAPQAIHPRALGERVVERYWPHTSLYGDAHGQEPIVLRQNRGGQAEIVSLVHRFRERIDPGGHAPLSHARAADAAGYRRLVGDVTWKLVQMPLPRLQRFGRSDERFLYDLDWDEHISRRRFEHGGVDQWLRLRPGVGDHLVRLAGLLRPLVQRRWAEHVVAFNRRLVPSLSEYSDLDGFLFGTERIDLAPVRGDLADVQHGECFYCAARLRRTADVDHFLPWARHPDNGIHNLVAAHPACNNRKRDFLAAADHVARWAERFSRPELTTAFDDIASARRWDHHPPRTIAVARAVYLRLPDDARLWLTDDVFVRPDPQVLASALSPGGLRLAAEDHASFDTDTEP